MHQSILHPFRKAAPEGGPPTRLASSAALLFPDRVSSDSRPQPVGMPKAMSNVNPCVGSKKPMPAQAMSIDSRP